MDSNVDVDTSWKSHSLGKGLAFEDDVWWQLATVSRTCQHDCEVALFMAGSPDRNRLHALLCHGSFVRQIKRQWCLICVPDLRKVVAMLATQLYDELLEFQQLRVMV